MRMLFTIAAATLTLAPVAAHAADQSFQHEGQTYVFETVAKGDSKIISGKRYPGAEPFRLVVRGDKVRGMSGYRSVSFKLSEVERINPSVKLAAR